MASKAKRPEISEPDVMLDVHCIEAEDIVTAGKMVCPECGSETFIGVVKQTSTWACDLKKEENGDPLIVMSHAEHRKTTSLQCEQCGSSIHIGDGIGIEHQ